MAPQDLLPPCPRCGRPPDPGAPEGLCQACLFAAGVESTRGLTASVAVTATGTPALQAGGEGPRFAVKVLHHRLTGQHERERFLREGQLAASITHPHLVYVFGSEEIAGVPVIAMELAPGGTLKDRVRERGPLAPAEAVDAILQVIAGLEAAQAAGILHRDVKPANCFIDRDGTIKVGDFGLSVSTMAREETAVPAPRAPAAGSRSVARLRSHPPAARVDPRRRSRRPDVGQGSA
jgi:eukaryotic-like serine/threonine-protein kinase